MKTVAIAILFYLIGLLALYAMPLFEVTLWRWCYYGWDKLKDLLLVFSIYSLINKKRFFYITYVLFFSIIRFLWEVVSYITGITVQNSIVVATLFLLLCLTIILIILKEARKKWKQLK